MGRVHAVSEANRTASDLFLSTNALEIGMEAFTNNLRSAKIAGTVSRPHEVIQYFPDLSEIVAEKRRIRRRWQRYKQFGDKVELSMTISAIFEVRNSRSMYRRSAVAMISGSWPIGSKVLVDMLTRPFMEEAVLNTLQKVRHSCG